ncbi:MAG TPA: hypothetical protein VGH06_02635, partial [Candidatus Udaeobacter sp.]
MPIKKFMIVTLAVFLLRDIASAQDSATVSPSPAPSTAAPTGTATTEEVVVQSQELDISREQIVPSLGATRYTIGPDRLNSQAQGENAPFQETILRLPGVAQDSFGQVHVRGEHANLQFRIDDVLVPENISFFSTELDTRFADSVSL